MNGHIDGAAWQQQPVSVFLLVIDFGPNIELVGRANFFHRHERNLTIQVYRFSAGQFGYEGTTNGTIGGVVQVVSAQGDGWVRGYAAETGEKLWEFDTNPKDSVWPRTRNEVISTPVVYNDRVYIANGQDPEHGEGVGHLYAIDAARRGDITRTGLVWHFDGIRRSVSTAAVQDGVVYCPDYSGFLHALDAKTGKVLWTHDMFAAVWGSPLLGDEDGDVAILQAGRVKKVLGEMSMGSSVYSTPVPAGGVLYISNRTHLYALAEKN